MFEIPDSTDTDSCHEGQIIMIPKQEGMCLPQCWTVISLCCVPGLECTDEGSPWLGLPASPLGCMILVEVLLTLSQQMLWPVTANFYYIFNTPRHMLI